MAHNNASWGVASPAGEDRGGPQVRPMGLKVHYTFDKESQERCLARWPQILNVQTIPMDGQTIGVVDLGLCLHAITQCSPELAGAEDKDYAVYALDYSEPDTPLVGQGLLSRELSQGFEQRETKLITGRVATNMLAIFGNGIKETLEVKLKLTAIAKGPRNNYIPRPHSAAPMPPNMAAAPTSNLSDNGEWGSFVQSHPGLGHRQSAPPMNLPTLAPAPVRPLNSSFEARNDTPQHYYPPLQPAPSSRPSSVDPSSREQNTHSFIQTPSLGPTNQSPAAEERAPSQPISKPAKPQTQSRPNSRASSRPPTGRPRGRPRKRPLASEGNTSGYEDGTDGDDGPSRIKKRATTMKAERSNAATFGSAPESLRVAASTAGSIRNFRPVAPVSDPSARSHLQEEGPRAPTPVPGPRFQGHGLSRALTESSLRRQSTAFQPVAFQPVDDLPKAPYPDHNASMSQDARSPTDSVAPSPFTDEASPGDISSSPPVPRSAIYSMKSSPAPSSPILPPMRMPIQQPDSGFMSGGLEDSRIDDEIANKVPPIPVVAAPVVAKPKPRRSRAKKQDTKSQLGLHIHAETPGPPELLPQTSIYNPPRSQGSRKRSTTGTPVATETQFEDSVTIAVPATVEPVITEEQPLQNTEQLPAVLPPQVDLAALEAALNDYPNNQQFLDSLNMNENSLSPIQDSAPQENKMIHTGTSFDGRMEPPAIPTPISEPSVEPELPAVPQSDPGLLQPTNFIPAFAGPYPQTDAVESMESRMNKNYVKRQAIKQKLEEAVASGQMPSFCSNCGALQTPTWRKIWKQERHGIPAYHEYSEKPGHVTAINVLERDDGGTPTLYEIIKKSLGPLDDKSTWAETILCNPCGIWFSKWKAHRPPEKWEKDEQRLTQTRKKRAGGGGGGASRSRKGRAKSDAQMLTSEACLPTDPAGPPDPAQSPKDSTAMNVDQSENASEKGSGRNRKRTNTEAKDQGSTHSRTSRASGTAMSPIDLDEQLGSTRRLLFPSPRKNGEYKILEEVAVNMVQIVPRAVDIKDGETTPKKNDRPRCQTPELRDNDFADLFGETPQPSTPPPKTASSGSFKTPTRPTPSHRPVTRSVSKSIRSGRSLASPGQGLLERTPTRTPRKTPRSASLSTAMPRRSPRHLPSEIIGGSNLGTPLSHSLNEMFSNTTHHDFDMDFSFDDMDQHSDLPRFDFSSLLPTDPLMPSSPPLRNGEMLIFDPNFEFEMGETVHFRFDPSPRSHGGVTQATKNGKHAP